MSGRLDGRDPGAQAAAWPAPEREPTQVVSIVAGETTFSATCDACGTAFAGRLDEDLDSGVFLCRSGHQIRIERAAPAAAADPPPAAEASAA